MEKINTNVFKVIIGLEIVGKKILFHYDKKKRNIPEEVKRIITSEWRKKDAKIGNVYAGSKNSIRLFRYEGHEVKKNDINIFLGETDYRETYGTNIKHPELADKYGEKTLSNALAVCGIIVTSDNNILLFRRSENVLEKPSYWHTIGGHLEMNKRAVLDGPNIYKSLEQELYQEVPSLLGKLKTIQPICFAQPMDSLKREFGCLIRVEISSKNIKNLELNFEHNKYEIIDGNLKSIVGFLSTDKRKVVPMTLATLYHYCLLRFDNTEITKWWSD